MLGLKGDEVYYHYHNKEGVLEGMREKLDISKLEYKEFVFTVIDVKKAVESIEISMDDYAKSLDIL